MEPFQLIGILYGILLNQGAIMLALCDLRIEKGTYDNLCDRVSRTTELCKICDDLFNQEQEKLTKRR